MSGDCRPGWGAKGGKRGSKADGGRVKTGTAVRADQCARPCRHWRWPAVMFLFHFEPSCRLTLHSSSSSYISDHLKSLDAPFPSLPSCAESPPSSRRGSQTSLTVVPLPTLSQPHPQVQVPPPIRPSTASHTESPHVVSLAPSPGFLSQQNDRKGPRHSQSLPTPHRLPRRARSHFAHQRMTVLVI